MVTWCSSIASSSAAWVLGVARLISSASSTCANTGPGRNSNSLIFWLKARTPVMSEGSRSGVNWMRRNDASSERASALASIVLPTPGTSSISRWPWQRSVIRQRRTSSSLSRIARPTFSITGSATRRTESSVTRSAWRLTVLRPPPRSRLYGWPPGASPSRSQVDWPASTKWPIRLTPERVAASLPRGFQSRLEQMAKGVVKIAVVSRYFMHAGVLLIALTLSGYASITKDLPASAKLRLGVVNAEGLTNRQGGTVGQISLGRLGTIIKPIEIPTGPPVLHTPIGYTVTDSDDL